MRVLGVIPARYRSTRLPGKPLAEIAGKPMIRLVYEAALRSKLLDDLLVATDDERIVTAVESFGGKAVLTPSDLPTGTDRVAVVVRDRSEEIVVNVQGDEPFLDPVMIDEAVAPLLEDETLNMCTLMHEVHGEEAFADPNVVKVVCNLAGDALYFSRSLIPYPRSAADHHVYEHIGLYAYRRQFVLDLAGWPQTPLERLESLEQLRVLEHGVRLRVVKSRSPYVALSVDTPEDLKAANALAAERAAT
ncbi:3-deoxy-manno-octulosonate cytidylyltransferase [Salinispira pacifica]